MQASIAIHFKFVSRFKTARKFQENIFYNTKFITYVVKSEKKKWLFLKKKTTNYLLSDSETVVAASFPLERLSRTFVSKWKAKQLFKSYVQMKKESQWNRMINVAKKKRKLQKNIGASSIFSGHPSNVLLQWESRLDITLWKSGLVSSLALARQLVHHGAVKINQATAKQSSRILRPGDLIHLSKQANFNESLSKNIVPFHLEVHYGSRTIIFGQDPQIHQIETPCPINIKGIFLFFQ